MNSYAIGIVAVVFCALFVAGTAALDYGRAAVLFGLVAALAAPVAVHKVTDRNWSVGLLLGLASFASFPINNLYGLTSFFYAVPVILVYAAALWSIGLGWTRSWR